MHFNHCNLEINIFTTVPVNADGLINLNYVIYKCIILIRFDPWPTRVQVIYMSRLNNRSEQLWKNLAQMNWSCCMYIYKHKSVQGKLKLWVFAQVLTSTLAYPLNISQLKIHKETYIYPSIAKIILMCTMLFT